METTNPANSLPAQAGHGERGSISVIAAVSMVAVMGVAALSVDVGHLMSERSDLQTAVDSGALHAAQSLVSGGSAPNFQAAGNPGKGGPAYIAANQNDPVAGGDKFSVKSDYWQNLNTNAPYNYPAVSVTYTKQVPMYLARVIGINSIPVTTTAIAIIRPGNAIGKNNTTMPLALSQCVINQYYINANGNNGNNDGGGNPNQPFTVGPSIPCNGNQSPSALFTTFSDGNGGNGTYYDILNNGNPQAIAGGQNIYFPNVQNQGNSGSGSSGSLDSGFAKNHYARGAYPRNSVFVPVAFEPGSVQGHAARGFHYASYQVSGPMMLADNSGNNIYQAIDQCSQDGNGSCGTVIVPVVSAADRGSSQAITGFACVNILSANSGGVTMSFATGCQANSFATGQSGTNSYGVYSPPQLAQ